MFVPSRFPDGFSSGVKVLIVYALVSQILIVFGRRNFNEFLRIIWILTSLCHCFLNLSA